MFSIIILVGSSPIDVRYFFFLYAFGFDWIDVTTHSLLLLLLLNN